MVARTMSAPSGHMGPVTQAMMITYACGHQLSVVNADYVPVCCPVCWPPVRERELDSVKVYDYETEGLGGT
jgi:hypothetical protein